MDLDPKFTFVEIPEEDSIKIYDKKTKELLKKWGVNMCIQEYLFNEPFHQYHKYQLAEAFLKDQTVAKTLKTFESHSWKPRGVAASSVQIKQIPCSILNMSFFDKMRNPGNNIIHHSGTICKRFDVDMDGFLVADNLRGMLLDDESSEYILYDDNERQEFIFRIFQMLVLGGELCQYEDDLQPYLSCTKHFYKNLIRVQTSKNCREMSVSTMVFDVVAKDHREVNYLPGDPENKQNMTFLLIDGDVRRVRIVGHRFSGYFG